MSNFDVIDLTVASSTTIDATAPFKTDGKKISRSIEWSCIFKKSGMNGDPIVTVEGAFEDVDASYVSAYEDPANPGTALTQTLSNAINTIRDSDFPYQYFRLNVVPNTNTTGTMTIQMGFTQDS